MFTENDKSPLSHIDFLFILWVCYIYLYLTAKSTIFTLIIFIAISILYVFLITDKRNVVSQKIGFLIEKYNALTLKWAENHSKSLKFAYIILFFTPVVLIGLFLNILPQMFLMITLVMVPVSFSMGYAKKLQVKV
ncbi:hypothetical protein NEF87_003724 [Candidatus Lokiarchaeum ossiferum]|uniref:Uncharacterized protein n=1 Tax=Candidatus Lokiarchaeum ossiferum TaxID=2951803 RepID=A0ABY6HV90_9ARCH|nr:hypothetical protein NEF87_003724 [Candidatus Lokiarchaeum sp. B-35]